MKIFDAAEVSGSGIVFPVAFSANTFTPGRTYTFRLSATLPSSESAYSEISLTTNSPPSSGVVNVRPTNGIALTTSFFISSNGWVDDLTDYPISFDFWYQISDDSPPQIISGTSLASSVRSVLPSGLSNIQYYLNVICRATDIYNSSARDSQLVKVTVDRNLDPTAYLLSSLSNAAESRNYDATFQAINFVSSMVGAINCSNAPNCTILNRARCSKVVNTCGSCLVDFRGVADDDNSKCHRLDSNIVINHGRRLTTNDSVVPECRSNTDCLYGLCINSYCAVPPKVCPTNYPTEVCSGHGVCRWLDSSNMNISSCLITNSFCRASCLCRDGYGGVDCSLNSIQLTTRSDARISMCNALLQTIEKQDASSLLLDVLVTSLRSVYNPFEFNSSEGHISCSRVMGKIGLLASDGYMKGSSANTKTYFVELLSSFVLTSSVDDDSSDTVSKVAKKLDATVANFVQGTLATMVAGQLPVIITSSNIQLKVSYQQSSLATTLLPPAKSTDIAYNVLQPRLYISQQGMAACDSGNGYAKMSTLKFNSNPHAMSSAILSPLLHFASYPVKSRVERGVEVVSQVPLYYVTLPFNTPREFNTTAWLSRSRPANISYPSCTLYDGSKYVPCRNCNISSLTMDNVTYGCYNIQNLCPSKISKTRNLLHSDTYFGINDEIEDVAFDTRRFRILATDDLETSVDSQEIPTDDGIFSSGAQQEISEFGVFLGTLFEVIAEVFSINPYTLDYKQATVMISFIGTLAAIIIIGSAYFLMIDDAEKTAIFYDRSVEMSAIKNMIMDKNALSFGGHGVATSLKEKIVNKPVEERAGLRMNISKRIVPLNSPDLALNFDQFDIDMVHDGSIKHKIDSHSVKSTKPTQEVSPQVAYKLVDHFADAVSMDEKFVFAHHFNNESYRVGVHDSFTLHALYIVIKNHYMTHMIFGGPSIRNTRTLRFLDTVRTLLINIFVYCVFFTTLYPSQSTCVSLTTKELCLSVPSRLTDTSTGCIWDNELGCAVNPPPSSITFSLVITLLWYFVAVPIDIVVGFVQDEFAAKYPDFGPWMAWVNNSFFRIQYFSFRHKSTLAYLKYAANHAEATKDIDIHHKNRQYNSKIVDDMELGCVDTYADLLTPKEEISRLTSAVSVYFHSTFRKTASIHDMLSNEVSSTTKAIHSYLHMNADCTLIPLNWRERLYYKNRQDQLEKKVMSAKVEALKIAERINRMGISEESYQDISLIHHFMLENIHWYYRIQLRYNLIGYDILAGKIHPIIWVLSWVFILGFIGFMLYYIFIWGVTTGPELLPAFGLYFGIGMCQDIFFAQILKILILKVLAVIGLRPQIRIIKRVITDAALSVLQENASRQQDMRIVQHFSPSCRAARLKSLQHLPSSSVLKHINDYDVEKCRQKSFIFMGTLTFILIFLPALLALISTMFLQQLMDVVLYSAINIICIVCGFVYLFSATMLIAVVVGLGGLAIYYWTVFAPSIRLKTSIISRLDMHKKSASSISHSNNRLSNVMFTMKQIWYRILDILGTLHLRMSFTTRRLIQEQRNKQDLSVWRAMNLQTDLLRDSANGSVIDVFSFAQEAGNNHKLNKVQEWKLYVAAVQEGLREFPACILAMRSSGEKMTCVVKQNMIESVVNKRLFDTKTALSTSDVSTPYPTIHINDGEKVAPYRRYFKLNSEHTTQVTLAVERMLMLHVVGHDKYHSSEAISVLDSVDSKNIHVTFDDLTHLINWVFGAYYPGGYSISEQEKEELFFRLKRWWIRKRKQSIESNVSPTIRMVVSFYDFGIEFSNEMENFIRDHNDHISYIRNEGSAVVGWEGDKERPDFQGVEKEVDEVISRFIRRDMVIIGEQKEVKEANITATSRVIGKTYEEDMVSHYFEHNSSDSSESSESSKSSDSSIDFNQIK